MTNLMSESVIMLKKKLKKLKNIFKMEILRKLSMLSKILSKELIQMLMKKSVSMKKKKPNSLNQIL